MRRHSYATPLPPQNQQPKEKQTPVRRVSDAGYSRFIASDDGAKYQWSVKQENSRPAFVVNNPNTWKPNNSPHVNKEIPKSKLKKQGQSPKTQPLKNSKKQPPRTQLPSIEDEDLVEVIPEWKRKLFEQKKEKKQLAVVT